MVEKKAPLDGDEVDLLERELEEGVQVDRPPKVEPEVEEDSSQTMLGGLIGATEHVSVHELKKK